MRTLAFVALLAAPAGALTLDMPPGAERTAEVRGGGALAAGAFDGMSVPLREGTGSIRRTGWRVPGATDTGALMSAFRAQVESAGLVPVFACEGAACGGFDFRFGWDILDAPEMFVDLTDFRYLLAEDASGAPLSLLVSRGRGDGYVQLGVPEEAGPVVSTKAGLEPASGPLWAEILREGRAALDDLLFATGSAELMETRAPSLAALAEGLASEPERRIALVGHTDAVGGLAANARLSERRAEAVRRALIEGYGVEPSRVVAEGVGYLAPRASNETPEGREANRRVEAVLTE